MPVLEEFLDQIRTQPGETSVAVFVLNMLLSGLACSILGAIYVALGSATSNRARFARNFILLGVTTTLIVTVIKTSLALSLGLVGALSIIRFRGAIKEPEELAYLFACIAIGLGCGAGQILITGSGFCVLCFLIFVQSLRKKSQVSVERSVMLSIWSGDPLAAGANKFAEILKRHCPEVSLRRLDVESTRVEAVFVLPGVDFEAVEKFNQELLGLSDTVRVSVLDNEGIF